MPGPMAPVVARLPAEVLIRTAKHGMLSITAIAPGEVGVRETLLGIVVVGLIAGIWIGRSTERARRTYKDWGAAKTALKKGRSIAMTEVRKAAVVVVVLGGIMLIIFIGAMHAPG